jgi:LDH2 family malate/lactate/ureidoglycolate dehydrogenase
MTEAFPLFAPWRSAFRSREEFVADVDDLFRSPRETVRVAGGSEFAAKQDRRAHGVPIHSCVVVELEQIALKMTAPFPRRTGVHT